jgi:hypothetical protein
MYMLDILWRYRQLTFGTKDRIIFSDAFIVFFFLARERRTGYKSTNISYQFYDVSSHGKLQKLNHYCNLCNKEQFEKTTTICSKTITKSLLSFHSITD